MEFACTYETDVADLSWRVLSSWVWLPQGVTESMILDRKLIAKNLIVCHEAIEWSVKTLIGVD